MPTAPTIRANDTRASARAVGFHAGAALVSAAALAGTLALAPVFGGVRFFVPLAAVTVYALLAGTGPGLTSTFLAVIGFALLFEPRWQFSVDAPQDIHQMIAFALIGSLLSVIGGARHRSRRKLVDQTWQAIQAAREARYAAEILELGDAFIELDADFRVMRVNSQQERILQTPRSSSVGRVFWEVWPQTADPESEFSRQYRRCMRERVAVEFEEYLAPLDLWLSMNAYPTSSGGLAIFIRDITPRKRFEEALQASEEKFRSVFEQAGIGMGRVSFDDARWIDVNQAFCDMLGYSREEMIASSWPEMTHPEDLEQDLVPFRRMAAGELSGYTVEKRFLHKQGHAVWARLTLSVVRDARGTPDYEVAIIEDISDRKRAEQALADAHARLVDADRRKNEFISMLSHELRNPLAPIRNSLYVLERVSPGGQKARNAHEVIGRQVQHMTRLIDDLLDVTRITRGKVSLHRERLDLCTLTHRTADDHRQMFESLGIVLRTNTCDSRVMVDGDATRLSQIIGNLLSNAAKFTPRGGRVSLSVHKEHGMAVMRVSDNGAGIAPELVDTLFDPFVQAEATLDRSKGGLGLGLALVKGLSELHGGSASVHSDGPGKGAEFSVLLPLADPEETLLPRISRSRSPGAKQSLRILLIEDNTDAADSLRDALELDGHRVEVAATGHDGIEKARQIRPDIVLCDLGLPGIDGYEVARRLRADPELAAAPLIALSGYAGPEDQERSRDAGFAQHLAKPPDLDVLENAISQVWSVGRGG